MINKLNNNNKLIIFTITSCSLAQSYENKFIFLKINSSIKASQWLNHDIKISIVEIWHDKKIVKEKQMIKKNKKYTENNLQVNLWIQRLFS